MGFSYGIEYKSGIENRVADALSGISASEIMLLTLSVIQSDLHSKLQQSYIGDTHLETLL